MIDLAAIRNLRTQFIYHTITLPPCMRVVFQDQNHLLQPKVIRASTTGPFTSFLVCRVESPDIPLVQQLVKEIWVTWQEPSLFDRMRDQIILCSRTEASANELPERFSAHLRSRHRGEINEVISQLVDLVRATLHHSYIHLKSGPRFPAYAPGHPRNRAPLPCRFRPGIRTGLA